MSYPGYQGMPHPPPRPGAPYGPAAPYAPDTPAAQRPLPSPGTPGSGPHDSSYGQPRYPVQALPQQAPPQSVTRAPGMLARLGGGGMMVLGLVLVGGVVLFFVNGELIAGCCFLIGASVTLVIGCWLFRMRTVFDASGIHSCWGLGTRHLPWPASRADFEVKDQAAKKTGYRAQMRLVTVSVSSNWRSFPLFGYLVWGVGLPGARARAHADLDAIWSWAVAQGYVSPPAGRALTGDPQPGWSQDSTQEPTWADAEDRAVTSRTDYRQAYAPDRVVLRRREESPWRLLNWAVSAPLICLYGASIISRSDPTKYSGSRSEILGQGALTAAIGILVILIGITVLVVSVWAIRTRRTTLVVTRSGFELGNGVSRKRFAWPTSRSSLFAAANVGWLGRDIAVFVLDEAGNAVEVPGMRWSAADDLAMTNAVRVVHDLWSWGESRGVARDDGAYRPARKASVERGRASLARRLAYNRTGIQ